MRCTTAAATALLQCCSHAQAGAHSGLSLGGRSPAVCGTHWPDGRLVAHSLTSLVTMEPRGHLVTQSPAGHAVKLSHSLHPIDQSRSLLHILQSLFVVWHSMATQTRTTLTASHWHLALTLTGRNKTMCTCCSLARSVQRLTVFSKALCQRNGLFTP